MEPVDDFIINFLARRESPEDAEKLKEWLDADPSRRDELKRWLFAWDTANAVEMSENIDVERAFERFQERRESPALRLRPARNLWSGGVFRVVMRVAAVFLVGFLLGIVSWNYFRKDTDSAVTFVESIVPLGSQAEIKLADGSVAWLNAGSSLRYSPDFGKTQRDVYLSGEGFFVIERGSMPFTVITERTKIIVTGTEFNVRDYPDEDVMETTLIRGTVLVETDGNEQPVLLQAGQKLSATGLEVVVTQLEQKIAEADASWKERKWRIEGMTLQDVALRLNRRLDVNVNVNERVKGIRFSGTFENETLEEILYVVQLATGINYRIEGRSVFIE